MKRLPLHPQRKRGSEKEEQIARWVTENQLLEKKSEKGKKKEKSEERFGEIKETLTFATPIEKMGSEKERRERMRAKYELDNNEWVRGIRGKGKITYDIKDLWKFGSNSTWIISSKLIKVRI